MFILSDIHGSSYYAHHAIKLFKQSKAEYLILLGDILYHGPRNPLPKDYNPELVFQLLNLHKDQIIAIRGNCDSEVDQMVLEFPIMEDYTFLPLKDRLLYLSHGHIYNPDNLPPGISQNDLFLFGHIHLPIAEKQQDIYIGNPGSCSLPKANNPPSYGILTDDKFTIYDFQQNVIQLINID